MPLIDAEDYWREQELKHYGIQRKSGRYPWGSGGEDGPAGASQRSKTFFSMVEHLESQGLSKADVAKGLGFSSTTELRQAVTIANNAVRSADQDKAEKLRAKGWSHAAIGREFDPPKNESSVRQLLDKSVQERTKILNNTVQMLRDELDKGGFVSVGKGTEYYVAGGVSKEKLASAVAVLKDEGYGFYNKIQVDQAGTTNKTTYKVLTQPGVTYKDIMTNKDQIREVTSITDDGGRSYYGILPPLKVSQDRIAVKYAEDGGSKEDGTILVRPGVKDVEIGGSAYAQVRIDVEGTHYLKGMARYSKDLPPGVDIMFNTNKKLSDVGPNKLDVMKKQTEDKDNPFGAVVRRQITAVDANGKHRVTSAMNILQEEGSWDSWSRSLSSQVLAKQSPVLAKQQLDKTFAGKRKQLDEILALTNPTVRKTLLEKFGDEADSSAVHLEAAGLPRSSYHVILPFNKLKDNEIYAPNYQNGEQVALVRYPHGGKFEIPVLTVNNSHKPAIEAIGRAKDAVGINYKVAERMSGADFDGDFVMVIPNDRGSIKSEAALKQLDGFDPQSYKLPKDAPRMSAKAKGKQMGDVSNLITDMTIKGAKNEEIARAVKHSMVVIDAEKHHLDWKKSAVDNGIPALKTRYQGGPRAGADTLISLATSDERVNKRRAGRANEGGPIDAATGKKRFVETGEGYEVTTTSKRTGQSRTEFVKRTESSTKLAETDDAHSLSSGTLMEKVYADHSNKLKALANESRREMVATQNIPRSPSAAKVYKDEVSRLDAALAIANMNSPRERQAQILANTIISMKRDANPNMDAATLKKVKAQALTEARLRAGAKKELIVISDREWDAIQAGAISPNKLNNILKNSDLDRIKELATPKPKVLMSSTNTARAKRLLAGGATQAEVAATLGISVTTLKEGLNSG